MIHNLSFKKLVEYDVGKSEISGDIKNDDTTRNY